MKQFVVVCVYALIGLSCCQKAKTPERQIILSSENDKSINSGFEGSFGLGSFGGSAGNGGSGARATNDNGQSSNTGSNKQVSFVFPYSIPPSVNTQGVLHIPRPQSAARPIQVLIPAPRPNVITKPLPYALPQQLYVPVSQPLSHTIIPSAPQSQPLTVPHQAQIAAPQPIIVIVPQQVATQGISSDNAQIYNGFDTTQGDIGAAHNHFGFTQNNFGGAQNNIDSVQKNSDDGQNQLGFAQSNLNSAQNNLGSNQNNFGVAQSNSGAAEDNYRVSQTNKNVPSRLEDFQQRLKFAKGGLNSNQYNNFGSQSNIQSGYEYFPSTQTTQGGSSGNRYRYNFAANQNGGNAAQIGLGVQNSLQAFKQGFSNSQYAADFGAVQGSVNTQNGYNFNFNSAQGNQNTQIEYEELLKRLTTSQGGLGGNQNNLGSFGNNNGNYENNLNGIAQSNLNGGKGGLNTDSSANSQNDFKNYQEVNQEGIIVEFNDKFPGDSRQTVGKVNPSSAKLFSQNTNGSGILQAIKNIGQADTSKSSEKATSFASISIGKVPTKKRSKYFADF